MSKGEMVRLTKDEFRTLMTAAEGSNSSTMRELVQRLRETVSGTCGAEFRDTGLTCSKWAGHDEEYKVGSSGHAHVCRREAPHLYLSWDDGE